MFLEEVMTLAPGSDGDPFTRVAYFNYNPVERLFEYISMDSRAPQMMTEKSAETTAALDGTRDAADLSFQGDTFVAPQWGEATNVAFRYRRTLEDLTAVRQVSRLYLTPLVGDDAEEFLAFEYVYTRQ